MTTLHGLGGDLGWHLDTFFWALTISWSRLLACVRSGPNRGSKRQNGFGNEPMGTRNHAHGYGRKNPEVAGNALGGALAAK